MKKFLLTILCFILGCLGLVACTKPDDPAPTQTKESSIAYAAVIDDGTAKTTTSIPAGMYKQDGKYPVKYVEGTGTTISDLQEYVENDFKYTFGGWFSDEACATAFEGIGKDATGDVKVYAKVTKGAAYITKTITYKAVLNGTEMEVPLAMFKQNGNYPTTYKVGQTATVADLDDITEYTFEGWFTDKACTTAFTGVKATDTENLTIYAKLEAVDFSPQTKTITYIAVVDGDVVDGGAAIIDGMKQQNGNYPASYEVGQETTISDLQNTTAYTFEGWFTDEDCTTEFAGITATTNTVIVLYAKIVTVQPTYGDIEYYYKIGSADAVMGHFSVLRDSDKTYPSTYKEGEEATVPSYKSSVTEGNTKYTFGGWYTDAACTQKFNGTIPATQTGKVTLYAKITSETVSNTSDDGNWTKNY